MKYNMSFKSLLISIVIITVSPSLSFAQKKCTSNPSTISSNINFGSITWTASGGATVTECNNMADGISTFTGDVIVDISNNRKITITNNVNITGNFPISGGPGSTLSVNGGFTLYVTGDLGDAANNGVSYEVVTASDKIIVDGTLYGKNNNGFSGSGSISGGTLNVKNGTTCGSPCPAAGGFSNCTAGDSFCTNNSVLPVSLLFFQVKTDNNSVSLNWASASELNFDYFSIERSGDAFSFIEIGRIKGNGTTDVRHDYSFIDYQPIIGNVYYRLKTVDFDGYTEYFNIESIAFANKKSFTIYPNPVVDQKLNLISNFESNAGTEIRATDLNGVEVFSYRLQENENQISIPVSLEPGTYLFRINNAEFTEVKRIVVK